jgi:hypothetical protein
MSDARFELGGNVNPPLTCEEYWERYWRPIQRPMHIDQFPQLCISRNVDLVPTVVFMQQTVNDYLMSMALCAQLLMVDLRSEPAFQILC